MPIGSLLQGFTGAYSDQLVDDRKRQREAEDKELDNKKQLLDLAIKSMSENPANAELVRSAYADWLTASGSIGKKRKSKGGMAGIRGETDLPPLPFLDSLVGGNVPMFGSVGLQMGQGGRPQPQSGITPTQTPMDGIPGQRFSPGPGPAPDQGMLPPAPIPPQPYVPQPPGTGRMMDATNQMATSSMVDPLPRATYSPGLMLSPEDKARVEGVSSFAKKRMEQEALLTSLRSVGANDKQLQDALIPGNSTSSPYFSPREFIEPTSGNRFYGYPSKDGSGVTIAGTDTVVQGAVPYGARGTVLRGADDSYNILNYDTGGYTQPSTVPTGIKAPPQRPIQVVGPGGNTTWQAPQGAIGKDAPQSASTDPTLREDDASAAFKRRIADIKRRVELPPGHPEGLSQAAANDQMVLAQEEYDAKTNYNRSESGGTLPAAPIGQGFNATPEGGSPWYKVNKMPPLAAGTGPAWNSLALSRMREYLTAQFKTRGINRAPTPDEINQAMRNIRARTDAGLVK